MNDLPKTFGQFQVCGVSTDTRTVTDGNLFIPLKGTRFNGHEYVGEAFSRGAVAALWSRHELIPPPTDLPILIVDDTTEALQQLAAAYRLQLQVKVIGITGSNGKTSTKDILAGLLGTTYKTQKTAGNFNNHIGVPLTLLSLTEETEMAVIEMGMSGLGEIRQLAALAQPDIVIITNASEVHLGDLLTKERIVDAKLEILEGLKPGSLAVYNGDVGGLQLQLPNKLPKDVQMITFGEQPSNMFSPIQCSLDEHGVTFTLSAMGTTSPPILLPLLGKHQMMNALAALAVAQYLGIPTERWNEGLQQVDATGMRNELIRSGDVTIINDAYKSNPTSVRAALDTLYALKGYDRKLVVLGEMVELGEESEAMHRQIGQELDSEQIDMVFTIGRGAEQIALGALRNFPDGKVIFSSSKENLICRLKEEVQGDRCLVLVKGSRGLQLEHVVAEITSAARSQRKAVIVDE